MLWCRAVRTQSIFFNAVHEVVFSRGPYEPFAKESLSVHLLFPFSSHGHMIGAPLPSTLYAVYVAGLVALLDAV